MIFPGMDPFLEDPAIWHGFHNSLIVYVRDELQPRLGPRYLAAVEDRVFLEGPGREVLPDVFICKSRDSADTLAVADADEAVVVRVPSLEVHESYIDILDLRSGKRVVTTIEVASPTNKYAGPGREAYLQKQSEVRASGTHLVEIDLLRAGPHVLAVPEWVARGQREYDYLASVNRATGVRDTFELYPRTLRERLPRVKIPLADPDPDVLLDVQAVVERNYAAGRYLERIDYDGPCRPKLSADDEAWARQTIQSARERG